MIASTSDIDRENSESSFTVADLNAEQQGRLTQILDDYLRGLEEGAPIDVPQVLRENGDLAEVLQVYLSKLDGLHDIAAGFQTHGELEPLVAGEAGSAVRSLQLGEFTIVRELGRGGMGIVYEARQRTLDRRVAIKLLPLASLLDARQIARFKNESHAAAQLQHPHIVPVYSVGIERGIHYFAMQLIEGQTIDEWIASVENDERAAHWRQTVRHVIDVADALHCAHECGIVHRDIKPSNLMLDANEKVWVTDFGLARCQDNHSLTFSGDLVGTMRYMSPEQAGGRTELVDHRTDIYSLGATLYEMLTGDSAVQGDSGPEVLSAIVQGPTPRVRRTIGHIPADLDIVLQKSMSKNKDERYASALEFGQDLQAVLDRRPVRAKRPSSAVVVRRWASRHRRVVAASTLAFALGILGLLASVVVIAHKNAELKTSNVAADRNFMKAQEAVARLGGAVSVQLASIPGAEQVRQSVLRDTLAYYQEFVAVAEGDRSLRAELARTHSRIGNLLSELGSPRDSIAALQRADETYQQLLDATPDSLPLRQSTAQNLNQLGLALVATGQTSQATDHYRRAIQLQRDLVSRSDDPQLRLDLALTQSNFGLLLGQCGQIDQARKELSESIEAFSAVIKLPTAIKLSTAVKLPTAVWEDGDDVLASRGLAAALCNLSSLTIHTNPRSSIELLEQAIDHQLRISRASPNRLKASSEIATTYNSLGSARLAIGESKKAMRDFENAAKIHRRLHSIAPLVDRYRYDLAMSLNNLATAFHACLKFPESNRAAREAISLQEACLESETPDAALQSRLGIMYSNLGTSQHAMKDDSRSMSAFQKAIECQINAIKLNPNNRAAQRYLLQHYGSLMRLQIDHQQWRDAEQTIGLLQEAADDHPDELVACAAKVAEISKQMPPGSHRDRMVSNAAALLATARQAGATVDASTLSEETFRDFAHLPSFRRALQSHAATRSSREVQP